MYYFPKTLYCLILVNSLLFQICESPSLAVENNSNQNLAPIGISSQSSDSKVAPSVVSKAKNSGDITAAPAPLQLALAEPSVVSKAIKANDIMNRIHLSPLSKQIAEKLDLIEIIAELDELSTASATDLPAQLKRLQLKQKLNEVVLVVTLQVRDVAARIDRQVCLLNRQRQSMEDRRDRASRLNSIANLFSNGVMQELGQAGEMKVKEQPGEIVELVAGGITVTLGGLALKQQSGQKQTAAAKPNLLAKVFDRPINDDVDYPEIVWWYLNTAPPGAPSTDTRRQELLDRWRRFGVLARVNKPSDTRFAVLSNTNKRQIMTIGLLADQSSLLGEVKSEVYQLDHDLLQLMMGLQSL